MSEPIAFTRDEGELRTHAYNGLGETTSIVENGVTTTFAWNNDGRVTGMDLPGTANDPTFRYNGFGTRVDRVVGSSVETWKRAGAGVTASVLNDGVANFTPGISSRVGSTSTFTHAGLKNTTAQSEGLSITGTKTYDAFGLETATSGSWKTAFGYAGNFGYQKTDAGMKLLGHRYYDPETGRFLSRDPIKDGRNWYAYGAGFRASLKIADPTGLVTIELGVSGGFFKGVGAGGSVSVQFDTSTGISAVDISYGGGAGYGVNIGPYVGLTNDKPGLDHSEKDTITLEGGGVVSGGLEWDRNDVHRKLPPEMELTIGPGGPNGGPTIGGAGMVGKEYKINIMEFLYDVHDGFQDLGNFLGEAFRKLTTWDEVLPGWD